MNPETLTESLIDVAYDALEGCEDLMRYMARHGTPSLLILTQTSPDIAKETAEILRPHIAGKTVIEIGAGVGFLAIELARHAKSVIAIEADQKTAAMISSTNRSYVQVKISANGSKGQYFLLKNR